MARSCVMMGPMQSVPSASVPPRAICARCCQWVTSRRLRAAHRAVSGSPGKPRVPCSSARTYSILQRELSVRLRDVKLATLQEFGPEVIATANIGCLLHLGGAANVAVKHWIELIDEASAA